MGITGHVRDLGRDRWELIANLPSADGKRQRKSKRIEAVGVKRARAVLAAWLTTLEQHACTDPDTLTLGEVLRRWLEYAPENAGPKTVERYTQLVNDHIMPALGSRVVAEIEDTDLYAFYRAKQEAGRLDGCGGLSSQTCRHMHAVIRAALTFAYDRRWVRENVAQRVKHPPKPSPRKTTVWDEATQARALREAERTQVYVPCALGGWAGLRRGEVCALRWASVDFAAKAIAVVESVEQVGQELHFGDPKTAKARRVVPIPGQLADLLREHKRRQDEMRLRSGPGWNSEGRVCCRADGQPVKPDTLTSAWAQFVRQHELPRIEFHGLRRSYLSRLHDGGAPDSLIMAWAGHADLRTTHGHYLVTLSARELQVIDEAEKRIAAAIGETDRRGVVHIDREITG